MLSQDMVLPASRVLSLRDGLLGSPVPSVLVAVTLNSYSVQGNKSTTVAVSVLPSTSAGARRKCSFHFVQAIARYVKTLYSTNCSVPQFDKNILKTAMNFHFWNPFLYFESLWHEILHFIHL